MQILASTHPTILLVDEDPALRALVRAALESKGIEVVETAAGQQAMALFSDRRPDLVLLGYRLSDMSGLILSEWMHNLAGIELAIIMMLEEADFDAIESAQQVGATDFMLKPINAAILSNRVRFFLDTARRATELVQAKARAEALARDLQAERDLFAGGPIGVLIWRNEENWPLVYASSNIGQIFGYSAEQMLAPGFRFADCVHPDDLNREIEAVAANMADTRLKTWEQRYRLILPDGQVRWLYDFTVAERDQFGRVRRLRGYVMDETARMSQENTLNGTARFVSQHGGENFLNDLVEFAARTLGADYAHVALHQPDSGLMRIEAACLDGELLAPGRTYSLQGTPCEGVLEQPGRCYPNSVQTLFPRDRMLAELSANAFMGDPIVDIAGHHLGVIVLVTRTAFPNIQSSQAGLRILAGRVGAEMVRQQVETAVLDSRNLLRTVIDENPNLIFMKDWSGNFLLGNRALADLYGTTPQGLIGKSDSAFNPNQAQVDFYLKNCREVMLGGITQVVQEEATDATSGAVHFFQSIKKPLKGPAGEDRLLVIANDITELKLAQRQVEESELRLEYALAAIGEGVWDWDLASNQVRHNSLWCQIMGLDDNYLEHPLEDFIHLLHPEDADQVGKNLQLTLAGQGDYLSIHRICQPAGSEIWVLDRGRVVKYDESGRPQRMVGSVRDITEQKKAEAALNASEERYRLLLQYSPVGIFHFDPDLILTFCNKRFAEIFGRPQADYLGLDLKQIRDPRLLPALRAALAGEQGLYEGEYQATLTDRTTWIAVICSPLLDSKGQFTGGIAILNDVSERHVAQVELERYRQNLEALVLERTAQLEAANQAKSAFLANMSHEIRTPMNAIIGLTELLRRDADASKRDERLDKITTAAKHLLALINDILDISKIEAGKVQLELADFRLESLLNTVQGLVADKLRLQGLTLERRVDADLPARLRGDAMRLGQILVNFASNAVKFTERGGITLIVRKLNESADGIAIRFAVADTGIGVSPEQQSRIFNAFEQGDSSTTKQYGGTGLGLAISQRLAELMGGRVGVDSELGQGSTFWLELTLLKARNDAPAESTPMLADSVAATDESRWDHLANALRRRRSKRVLLVEDNLVNQEVALDLLGEVGLQIDLAENGQQAVERVQKQDYDLVLMDMQMPVLDGIGATRLIRALPGRASLPIIAMTANAFAEDRQRCLAAGMNDHVAKPVSGELLYETLLQWLPPEEDAEVETAPPVTAAPTTEADRLAALAELTEIDVQAGLNNMMGRVPSYLRLLSHFAEGAQASNERLKKALAGGEAEALRDAAHSVKGTSGALGLLDLHVRAQALEAAVRQKQSTNQVSEMTEDLIAAQTFMAKALQAILIS